MLINNNLIKGELSLIKILFKIFIKIMTSQEIYSINKDNIKNMNITIIGYGNKAKNQALNLKDYGCNVTIGLRNNSKSIKNAEKHFQS